MLSKKQAKLIKKLHGELPRGENTHFDVDSVGSYLASVVKIEYINREGIARLLPMTQEEKDILMRQSDASAFYACNFVSGERLLLMYDSKSKELPKEIELPYPCRMLNPNKYYFRKDLEKLQENNFVFVWDSIWSNLE